MYGKRDIEKIFFRFLLLAVLAGVLVLCLYLIWLNQTTRGENERRALAEARTLNTEVDAVWDYIDSIQSTEQNMDTKLPNGVYCVVAAKNIARRFSEESDYSIRYVRNAPRNKDDEPDEFEAEALRTFEISDQTEVYALMENDGRPVFRYVSELKMERSCLDCHGEPAGEKDVKGYIKEGMGMEDVGGAVSIVMPMDTITEEANRDLTGTLIFFFILMAAVGIILIVAMRKLVTKPIISTTNQMMHELEEQSRFLAIVSHELKTPLSAIIAFSDLWEAEHSESTSKEMTYVKEVKANGQTLLSLVNNLLDAAKLDSGAFSLDYDEIDVYDVVNSVRSSIDPLAKKKNVVFETFVEPDTPIVMGDADVLRRIAVNLASNALRYTDSEGNVRLSIGYENGCIVIQVSDTGIGIPNDLLPHVFDRFVSATNTESSSLGGVGLGLYIVKSFADLMGGSVEAKSEMGKGSTFVVRLPLPTFEEAEGDLPHD